MQNLSNLPTVDSARRALAIQLDAAGIESPLLDARLLIGAVLDLDLTGLAAQAQRPLMGEEISAINGLASRRLAGEPVARILGRREFWGLTLRLSPETLVPRPDTETVVEAALALSGRDAGLRIADVGTGSGAILLALLRERPNAVGIGTDISAEAIATARSNARSLRLSDRASFVSGNYAVMLTGPFDLIVSNPPYIATAEIATLDRAVQDYDPRRALDGGADGLAAYRTIAGQCLGLLAPDGALVIEIGAGQAVAVEAIFTEAGFALAGPPRADLSGTPRALVVRQTPR